MLTINKNANHRSKKAKNYLNLNNTPIDDWLSNDLRDPETKAIIMYFQGFDKNFISQKLNISTNKLNNWLNKQYDRQYSVIKNKKPRISIQDGKSPWVSNILYNELNKINNRKFNGSGLAV